jgi:hypothetical protein
MYPIKIHLVLKDVLKFLSLRIREAGQGKRGMKEKCYLNSSHLILIPCSGIISCMYEKKTK